MNRRKIMKKRLVSALLFIIGLASAVVFIVFRHSLPLRITVVLKMLPTFMMALWLITQKIEKANVMVFVGILLAMIGDLFMEIPGETFLMIGIVVNTLAIISFTLYFYFSDRSGDWVRLIPVAIVMGVFYIILYDYLAELRIPVLVYCIIHTLFLWRSSARFGEEHISPLAQYVCFIGCVMVTISDFLLSLTIFGVLPDKALYSVADMILWWGGLFMLMITAEIRRVNIQRKLQQA